MIPAGSIGWFALHEALLAWRDFLSLLTAGHRWRLRAAVIGVAAAAVFGHGLAYLTLAGAADMPDLRVLTVITVALVTTGSLMLSQAMESVTRAFYARGDLDLILSSPAAASRLFTVRAAAMAGTIIGMTLVMAAPVINMLAWVGGVHWLGAYAVVAALAMTAVAAAIPVTAALFRMIGPKRTRAVAQVTAAVIGALFAIGLQLAAILSYGAASRLPAAQLDDLVRHAPGETSLFWLPAHAVLGEPAALAAVVGFGIAALATAIHVFAPGFGARALSTSDAVLVPARRTGDSRRFRCTSPASSMRRKEWVLLLRDPWLMSQTLMQLLYLLPAAFLLWRDFRGNASTLAVPVLIVAAGQLGGGLAWLAVSGEDAPELIATAPVPASRVLRAKTEAVLGCIVMIFAPFVMAMALSAPFAALAALVGILAAAGSATAIQYWFRTQARRGLFRRRQTSSRVATFAEALSSTFWAGTGALATAGTWFAVVPAVIVAVVVAGAWLLSPTVRRPAPV